ncbi:MAG TPA: cobalamin-independent methionine synthase II family protein [Myxococcaceae bacterium]
MGSWPRPPELLRAQRAQRHGKSFSVEFQRIADDAVLQVLKLQDEAGVDLVTDGEQRRDNFYSFVAEKLTGVKLMTLAEMLEVVEDKAGFERILQTLDVPAYSISNPTCVGKVSRRMPLAVDELKFVQRHTRKPVKVPLPGPYLLTRAMFVKEVTGEHYPSREELGHDVVRLLRDEVEELIAAGAAFIQFDEPVLTELVFTQGQTRTFMCAALAAGKDPAWELELAVQLNNRVLEGFEDRGVRFGLHVCRGNWSQDESTLLRGSYHPLRPYLERLKVHQLVLEYATERAGDLIPLEGKELGLGVANPRTERVETVAEVQASIDRALRLFPAERLFVNPDCGFGTFSNRPVNSTQVALAKMKVISEAARAARG